MIQIIIIVAGVGEADEIHFYLKFGRLYSEMEYPVHAVPVHPEKVNWMP